MEGDLALPYLTGRSEVKPADTSVPPENDIFKYGLHSKKTPSKTAAPLTRPFIMGTAEVSIISAAKKITSSAD